MSNQGKPSGGEEPEVVGTVFPAELSVKHTGVFPEPRNPDAGSTLSRVAMGLGVFGLLLAPVFGVGVVPAILGIVLGHIAKRGERVSRIRAIIGVTLSYVALIVGVAVAVLVALPIVVAFLVSTGYILAD